MARYFRQFRNGDAAGQAAARRAWRRSQEPQILLGPQRCGLPIDPRAGSDRSGRNVRQGYGLVEETCHRNGTGRRRPGIDVWAGPLAQRPNRRRNAPADRGVAIRQSEQRSRRRIHRPEHTRNRAQSPVVGARADVDLARFGIVEPGGNCRAESRGGAAQGGLYRQGKRTADWRHAACHLLRDRFRKWRAVVVGAVRLAG